MSDNRWMDTWSAAVATYQQAQMMEREADLAVERIAKFKERLADRELERKDAVQKWNDEVSKIFSDAGVSMTRTTIAGGGWTKQKAARRKEEIRLAFQRRLADI